MVRKRSTDYDWAKTLYEKCMLDRDDADYYAGKFVKHDLDLSDLPDLNQALLREVGIHRMGHAMAILKYAKLLKNERSAKKQKNRRNRSDSRSSESSRSSSSRSRSPSPKRSRKKQKPVKRRPSPSSSEQSSSDSSRSPSPPSKKKKSPGNNSKVAHIGRFSYFNHKIYSFKHFHHEIISCFLRDPPFLLIEHHLKNKINQARLNWTMTIFYQPQLSFQQDSSLKTRKTQFCNKP